MVFHFSDVYEYVWPLRGAKFPTETRTLQDGTFRLLFGKRMKPPYVSPVITRSKFRIIRVNIWRYLLLLCNDLTTQSIIRKIERNYLQQ